LDKKSEKPSIFANDDEFEEVDPDTSVPVTIELKVKHLQIIDRKRGFVRRGPYLRQLILSNLTTAPTYPAEQD
jgi:hypothetical protein